MSRIYSTAALRYRPKHVRVLFIAESPPAFQSPSKKSYFFFDKCHGGDILFATIVNAVLGISYHKHEGRPKQNLLKEFQQEGYWLIDAVEHPINKINKGRTPKSFRLKQIDKSRKSLLKRLKSIQRYNGRKRIKIVLIKNLVYECLAEVLRNEGYNLPQSGPIRFPGYHGDRGTIAGIKKALQ